MSPIIIDTDFALTHLRRFIPSFAELSVQESTLQRMTGITNQTFIFSHTNQAIEPKKVIFRVFGKTCEGTFINRSDETIVYEAVGAAGLGPKMLGYDNVVRAEEFLESRVLQAEEMNQASQRRQVALALSDFHLIEVPQLKKQPMIKDFFSDTALFSAVEQKINKRDLFTGEENKLIDEIRAVFMSESEHTELLSYFPSREEDTKRQVLFGHNDLLANNILVLTGSNEIKFIDFEYSHYNLRAYDIANYFNESMYDYSCENSPYFSVSKEVISDEDYLDFIRFYVTGMQLRKNKIEFEVERLINDEKYYSDKARQVGLELIEGEAQRIMKEELPLAFCLSHFYWGLWSLHMSKDPNIQFDYVAFAYERFQKYKEYKQTMVTRQTATQSVSLNSHII